MILEVTKKELDATKSKSGLLNTDLDKARTKISEL